jgi:stage III sporulation protein AE
MTIDSLDFSKVSDVLINSSSDAAAGIDFADLAARAVAGRLDFSPGGVISGFASVLFGESRALFPLIRDMVVITAVSALFKAAAPKIESGAAARAGFYVNYMVVVTMLLSSLKICFGVMRDMVNEVCALVAAAQPLMASLAVLSGGAARGAVFSPVALYAAAFLTNAVNAAVVPALCLAAVVRTINYISEKDALLKLADFIQSAVSIGLKAVSALFLAALSAQKLAAPAIDGVLVKAGRSAASLVPVVGQSLAGAVDSIMYFGMAARGGTLTALVISIAALCAAPAVKLAAFTLAFKAAAALMQPLCEERIADAIDGAGDLAGLALGVCAIVGAMAALMCVIILSFGF